MARLDTSSDATANKRGPGKDDVDVADMVIVAFVVPGRDWAFVHGTHVFLCCLTSTALPIWFVVLGVDLAL